MSDNTKPPADRVRAPLSRVLGKNQQVQDRVAQAGDDLSTVNAELKEHVEEGAHPEIDGALKQSEAIETEVQDVAQELVLVNAALAAEVAERQDLEERLSVSQANERDAVHASLHDDATGLPTLALFNDRLRGAIAQAIRHDWRLAVLFIDLDDFKVINDTHGHDVGDLVLSTTAKRLQAAVRSSDSVSRRSGDEFLLLMLEAQDDDSVVAVAEKILSKLEEPLEIEGATLNVRASIGIAIYPTDGKSAPALLKAADSAMYAAKRRKSRWALCSRPPVT